jgi:cysteine desulfurase
MKPYFAEEFGNPGSLHSFGQKALAAVDEARESIAGALGADFREIMFAGSATEANNTALRGVVARSGIQHPRIIVSATEHESVLETARDLEKNGAEVVYLPVDVKGVVKLEALKRALTERTVLVSVMYVNNETGAVQPLMNIADIIKKFRGAGKYPLFHTDAAQAFQYFDCRPQTLGADLMTLSAHKIYGPKGAGALYIRGGAKAELLRAITTGGGQEYALRSGTENVPAIAGFGKAVAIAHLERERSRKHVEAMRKIFLKEMRGCVLNADGSPHIANVWVKGKKAEDMLTKLDLQGVAVSSGSACRSRSFEPSHVLRAMGLPKKRIAESIRVSFGRETTAAEVRRAVRGLRSEI